MSDHRTFPWWAHAADPWRAAAKFPVTRESTNIPMDHEIELDRGVNFLVLTLQALGARTLFSCEGHPNHFYVLFYGTLDLALTVRARGYYAVELEGGSQELLKWSLRLNRPVSESERVRIHKWAAKAWADQFWKTGLADARKMSLTSAGPLWTPEEDRSTKPGRTRPMVSANTTSRK